MKDKAKSNSKGSLKIIMSGLPPSGSNNKVSVRSKTTSFNRPISCDVSEHKKEGKGIFSKLKKGSSNSRLDEESQYRESTPIYSKPINASFHHNLTNASLPPRIQGKNFDDDDYELDTEDTIVTKMEKLFNNNEKVVKNPALLGSLLRYLVYQNQDYYSVLFYLIVQHYKSTMQNKEFHKEVMRFINEIYTTFLHEKSVLKIEHGSVKPIVLEDLKTAKDIISVFDESSNAVYNHCIAKSIDKVKTSIAHGLFQVDTNIEAMSFEEKLASFNEVIKSMTKGLEEKLQREQNQSMTKETKEQELFLQDVISGVKSSLATIYFYFSKREKDENSDNVSVVSSKFNSFLGKSSENLPLMTNCILEKYPIFCSKIHKKTGGHSFFKKGKALKGHNFQEKNFEYPAECMLCDKLLWGIAPQGFMCSHCQGAAHKTCKEFVRITCQRDTRKYQRNSYYPNPPVEDDTHKASIVEENVSKEVNNNNNPNVEPKNTLVDDQDTNKPEEKSDFLEEEHNFEDGMQISTSSISSDISQSIKQNYVVSTATIVVTNNDDKPIENTYDTESMDSVPEICHLDKQLESLKSESEKLDLQNFEKKRLSPSYVPAGHVRSMADKIDKRAIPRSQSLRKAIGKLSENNIEISTLPRSAKRASESVNVQDLVQDPIAWSNDEDMKVGETFEADKELEAFPDHLSKDQDKAEYTRLLVLMEFHHKTKFTVMTLKRFDYLLIKPWPPDDTFLFKTLSLNCIVPLYELIKSLANTIESCRMKSTFTSNTAKKVSEWLVTNEETNLQEWLKYSIDLCCTNSLVSVKNTWKDLRKTEPKFHHVLNKRYNKMIMVEQLANMRPLLFNFPLIVNKLARDLSKFSKFKEETKIWKEIHEKFKRLPTFIDEHCMPLVQLINNGTIINSLDRSGWIGKLSQADPCWEYIIDFPKTAFHYKLFDFQEIKISNFRESGTKKTPAVFVKEISDAYAICYENILVLLQKENEKYVLKPFKATDSKLNPILIVENVHPSKGEKKGNLYELTIVFINVAVLTQVLFAKKETMDRWHDFMYKVKYRIMKKFESFTSRIINDKPFYDDEVKANMDNFNCADSEFKMDNDYDPAEEGKNPYLPEEVVAKCDGIIKEPIDEFLSYLHSLNLEENNEHVLFPNPTKSRELLISITHDACNLVKLCIDSLNREALNVSSSDFVKDELLDQFHSICSLIQNRSTNYKNNRERDYLSINDIDYTMPDMTAFQSMDISPPESENINESEEPERIPFELMDKPLSETTDIEIQDAEVLDLQQEYYLSEDFKSFVDDYVSRLIEHAQQEIDLILQTSDINSDNDQDSLCINHVSEPSA